MFSVSIKRMYKMEAQKPGLYRGIITSMLKPLEKGRLTISFPDGSTQVFGSTNEVSADLKVNYESFFKRCVLAGDVGFGEAYVDGLWDTENITNVIKWFLINVEKAPTVSGSVKSYLGLNFLKVVNVLSHLKNKNSIKGSRRNISEHYDLNNEFFSKWLDPTMTYSSAYFKDENMDLESAQISKYRRLSEKMKLKENDEVLEIGCGWGANAIFMAENYGANVTGITISQEQFNLATKRVKEKNLEGKIKIILEDYRRINGKFDKIISVEMLEAVGHEYLPSYFKKCHELLKQDGVLALQVITCPDSRYENFRKGIDWIQKHIFPGSLLPSVGAINAAVNATGDLTLYDVKDLGLHYARTLKTWRGNFESAYSEIACLGFDERFRRKWNYYLSYCEGAFEMRNINVMQMIYSRPNNRNI